MVEENIVSYDPENQTTVVSMAMAVGDAVGLFINTLYVIVTLNKWKSLYVTQTGKKIVFLCQRG